MQQLPDEFELLCPLQPSPVDRNDPTERSVSLLALESLLPVVKCFSGLTHDCDTGNYYIHGQISELDRKSFHDLAKCIGELSLPSDSFSRRAVQFSPQAFARLAQLQDPDGFLFPSLHRLNILGSSTALDFLHLFLTPSLKTLKIATIPVKGGQFPILSFLETAICEAPHIKNVILGPGLISDKILNICLKYQNLRRLELSSSMISINRQVFEHIGSLEQLEVLVLQNPFGRPNHSHVWGGAEALDKPVEDTGNPDECWVKEANPLAVLPEPSRSSFEPPMFSIAEPLCPERHPASTISKDGRGSPSPSVWSRCASPTPPSPSTLVDERRMANGNPTQITGTSLVEIQPNPTSCPLFAALKELTAAGSPALISELINCVGSSGLRHLSITFNSQCKSEPKSSPPRPEDGRHKKSKKKTPLNSEAIFVFPVPPPIPPSFTGDDSRMITSLVELSTQKWSNTLASVGFFINGTLTSRISFPLDTFKTLLIGPQMEKLEVSDFDVDSVDTVLHHLKGISASKLKVLHLPFHATASGISLSRLRFIALHCPHLVSFRCRFKHLSNVPTYDVPDPLSHQLQVLSVTNAEPHQDQQRVLQIARYLDSLFPNLRTIETHDEPGCNGDQWKSILDLIKLCQAVRMDDKCRLGEIKAKVQV